MENPIEEIRNIKIPFEDDISTDELINIIKASDNSIITALSYAFKLGYIRGKRSVL